MAIMTQMAIILEQLMQMMTTKMKINPDANSARFVMMTTTMKMTMKMKTRMRMRMKMKKKMMTSKVKILMMMRKKKRKKKKPTSMLKQAVMEMKIHSSP